MGSDPKYQRRRGVAAVELAVLLPLLVLLTLGIVELGWYLRLAQVTHNAARQGARAAVRHENSNAEVEAVVQSCLANDADVDPEVITVEISKLSWQGEEEYQIQSLDGNEYGEPIRVTVTIDYGQVSSLTNYLGLNDGNLSSFAVMRRRK